MPRLLLVDDSPTTRLAVRLRLERDGWEVLEADSVGRAMLLLADKTRPFSAAVVDYELPSATSATGNSLVGALRLLRQETRVILLTSSEDPQVRERAFNLGVHAFVPKSPGYPAKVAETLAALPRR